MNEEKENQKNQQETDYKILIDSGIKFLEDALVNLKDFVENSSFGKANKVEIDAIFRDVLQKTLDVLEQIRLKSEVIYSLEKLATRSHLEEIENRLNLLEKKVSSLGFATKMDLKELENKITKNLDKK